jgi:hypothetical protein
MVSRWRDSMAKRLSVPFGVIGNSDRDADNEFRPAFKVLRFNGRGEYDVWKASRTLWSQASRSGEDWLVIKV